MERRLASQTGAGGFGRVEAVVKWEVVGEGSVLVRQLFGEAEVHFGVIGGMSPLFFRVPGQLLLFVGGESSERFW